jgi:protocatechuate 3,4-dioxygenase beta subunit
VIIHSEGNRMNSSGIKRGLATAAITALAVTGIPAIASANTIDAQVNATGVVLYNTDTVDVTTKNDGVNTTVRLEAGAPSTVTSITFQYDLGAGYVDIATVGRNDDGAFSTEWNATPFTGATVSVRAIQTGATAAAGNNDVATGVTILGGGSGAEAVNLADGTSKGVYQSPITGDNSVIVSGTTSATSGSVAISRKDGTGADADASTATVTATPAPPATATGGTFKGVLDIGTYTFSGDGSADQIVVEALRDTEDHEAYTLYKQVITTVTATADTTTVPAGGNANVTVTVTDQNGAPIAGAQVYSSDPNTLVGYTDVNGQVTDTQSAADGATYYYANATVQPEYSAGQNDKRSADITVTDFTPAPTTLVATSADGPAFDFDENATGDITVQVKNQNGGNFNPGASEDIQYYWEITPFAGGAVIRVPVAPTTTTASDVAGADVTDDGKYNIAFPSGQPSGTYRLFASLEADGGGNGAIANSNILTVKAGEATVTYDETSPESAAAGSEEVVDGQVVLEDGTGLAGRSVALTFQQGAAGSDTVKDANFVPATGSTPTPNRTVITGADGSFTVTVDDPAETPQGTELGGNVDAIVAGLGASGIVNNQGVDFVSATPPTGSTVEITAITGTTSPGEFQSGTATVTAPDNTNLPADGDTLRDNVAGQLVTLTIDKGFFTSGAEETPSVVGADAGNLVNLGQTITAVTNSAGQVTFRTAIERDAGFDDDGLVKATVTASAGTGVTDTEDVDYDSATPLNGGTVEIALSPESEQDGPTDPAMVGDRVFYDVFVTDQFGNLVGGESVAITDNEEDISVWTSPVTSDFDDNGDFYVTASQAAQATITGTWASPQYEYTNTSGAAASGSPATEPRTGTADVEFYESVVTTTTIESTPEGEVPVGTAVTETVTVLDQEGNPIAGVAVEFIRNGPGAGDGDANVERTTNAQGKAFYTFIGTQAGVANITATVTSDDGIETLNDSVVFVADEPTPPKRTPIVAELTGKNLGAKDRLKVNAPSKAQGAEVRLYKVVAGKRIQVGVTRSLNQFGNVVFTVKDRNGTKVTKYVAFVVKTAVTLSDTTNRVGLR